MFRRCVLEGRKALHLQRSSSRPVVTFWYMRDAGFVVLIMREERLTL
jgi:hypothetical protein